MSKTIFKVLIGIVVVISVAGVIRYFAKNETDFGIVPSLHTASAPLDMTMFSASSTSLGSNIPDFSEYRSTDLELPRGTLHAYIADTPVTMELGLGKRSSLKETEGMLFVFDTPGKYGFWMKDMKFPISMVWLNGRRQIVGITRNISPDTFKTEQTFFPPGNILYVLEVVPSVVEATGMATGTYVKFVL